VPELPEVETVRRGLAEHVTGRTVETVTVLHPRAIRRHLAGPEDFADALAGRTIDDARRRGKYLWLPVGEDALLAHLGMSGQLLLKDPGQPLDPHVRVRFTFADKGPDLHFTDQRTFGHMAVIRDGAELPGPIAHIALDPFDPLFDSSAVASKLKTKHTGIKRALLDQSLISGVGNIYADEALWRAKLHWARPTEALTGPEVSALLAAVHEVMSEALNQGGTSFDSLYVNVNGQSGYFERSLAVYGREGLECRRCGAQVRRDPFMNRSSYSCPQCQPSPGQSTPPRPSRCRPSPSTPSPPTQSPSTPSPPTQSPPTQSQSGRPATRRKTSS
jgi:formamidopyrimidine-DNA glycosylase